MSKLTHVTTCPNCFKRVEVICSYYNRDTMEILDDLRTTWNYPNDSALFHATIEKWEKRK